jgi:hypothetical protein
MRVAAVIGSGKGKKSTSASLIGYLEKQLAPQGISFTYFFTRTMHHEPDRQKEFFEEIRQLTEEDIFIICAPDYVDSLPGPLKEVMEEMKYALGQNAMTGRKLLAAIHSGYPEPQQRRPALEICRNFAAVMGFQWCGGLSLGGTSPIDGQPLEASGPFGKKICPVMDRLAGSIAAGTLTKTEALVLEDVSTMPVPAWMAAKLMNVMTKIKSMKQKRDLRAQPYTQKTTGR